MKLTTRYYESIDKKGFYIEKDKNKYWLKYRPTEDQRRMFRNKDDDFVQAVTIPKKIYEKLRDLWRIINALSKD